MRRTGAPAHRRLGDLVGARADGIGTQRGRVGAEPLGDTAAEGRLAGPEAMGEIADVSATPRLAEALAALGESRTDLSFDLALEGFLAHARRTLEARGGASG